MPDNKKEQEREELHRAIWAIADDLRGAVDGWDFKSYVLGTMFYRYISENIASYINQGEIDAGNPDFRYEDMPEPVLKNASFSLEYGKLALLYGDSGQGKSSVLSILSGVIPNVTKGTLSGEVRGRIRAEDKRYLPQGGCGAAKRRRADHPPAGGGRAGLWLRELRLFAGEDQRLHRKSLRPDGAVSPVGHPHPLRRAEAAADHRLRPGNRAEDSPFRRAAGKS